MPRQSRNLLLLLGVYAAALAALVGVRPLWLDEILQLTGTVAESSLSALLRVLQASPGAAPLGYLIQHGFIMLMGFSVVSARISAAIFSVAGCAGLIGIFRELKLTGPWLTVICWMMLPLQLRYAVEGRPYSQALCFTILGTLCFFRLVSRPSLLNSVLFGTMCVAGLYSAPYSILIYPGYVSALLIARYRSRESVWATLVLVASVLCFIPWYLASASHWKEVIPATSDAAFTLNPRLVLLLIQELSGGGYVCSIVLLVLSGVGLRSPRLSPVTKSVLAAGALSGVALVFISDGLFRYFFAIRQVIFVLVPLIVLAGAGLTLLMERKKVVAIAAATLLIAGSLVKDYRYFSDVSENWQAAAAAANSAVRRGDCISATEGDLLIYQFFQPEITSHLCRQYSGKEAAIASSRYSGNVAIGELRNQLSGEGYVETGSTQAGGTTIRFYRYAR